LVRQAQWIKPKEPEAGYPLVAVNSANLRTWFTEPLPNAGDGPTAGTHPSSLPSVKITDASYAPTEPRSVDATDASFSRRDVQSV